MSVYLDASVVVSLFVLDPASQRAQGALLRVRGVMHISNLCAAEFVSALNHRMRMGFLTRKEAQEAIVLFDEWAAAMTDRVETGAQDFSVCDSYLRRLDLPLRTPDALHLAIAKRIGASLLTFDKQMIASAKKLGAPLEQA